MAYIGKVKVNKTWASVESLVQEQIEGQSSFSFDESKNYFLQPEHATVLHLCNCAAEPGENDGEWACDNDKIIYKKDESVLYVKADTVCMLSISELI